MIRLTNWIIAWVDMFCGLLGVLTFMIYRPWWDMQIRIWLSKQRLQCYKEKNK